MILVKLVVVPPWYVLLQVGWWIATTLEPPPRAPRPTWREVWKEPFP